MNRIFDGSLQHILAELTRIDIKARIQLMNMSLKDDLWDKDEFKGQFIPEEEINSFLSTNYLQSDRSVAVDPGSPSLTALIEALKEREAEIAEKTTLSLNNGVTLRLVKLAELFQLSPFDVDALLVCLLPEIEPAYEKLYAYIQDDVTKRSVDIGLVLHLLCRSIEEKLSARRAFSQQSTLVKHLLLRVDSDSQTGTTSFLARRLQVDGRILDYLFGSDLIDARLVLFACITTSHPGLADVILSESIKQRLMRLVTSHRGNTVFYFQGPRGTGKQTTAEALCHDAGIPLLVINVERLLSDELPPATAVQLLFRESKILGAALYWDRFDLLLAEDRKSYLNSLIYGLESCTGLNFLAGEASWERPDTLREVPFVNIQFPVPSYEDRKQLWKSGLNSHSRISDTVDLSALSNKFVLTGGQIRDAVADARNLALWQESESLCIEDLYHACRARSNQKLGVLAHNIESKDTWADIVLPDDQMQQLHELTGYVKYHQLVYGEWNFDQKFSYGKGLNVLFTGPSGTGKTMAAGIMANELKLDIYKIDLSTIFSKYVGETEKNLAKIFNEAERSNAILFFDEADALFGKRSEVRDSHDRYANIEISYLLQRMEEFEGMVILATNLHKNMDDAFVRRMHFIIEFPLPEEEDRYRIWSNIFPAKAPLAEDVDLRFMARQFKIAGGNIKNIALNAAFLAAEGGGAITMKHLIRATRREFQKIGKLCVAADFGKYHALVAGESDRDG